MWQKDRPLQTAPSTCCWKSQSEKKRKAWSPQEELQEWVLRNARLTNQWCQQVLLIRFLEYRNTVISLWLLKACASGTDIEGSGSEQDVSWLERIVDWLPFSFQNFDFFLLGHQYKHHHLYQMQQRHQLLTCHAFAPHQATPKICIMKLVWINNILNKNSNCK